MVQLQELDLALTVIREIQSVNSESSEAFREAVTWRRECESARKNAADRVIQLTAEVMLEQEAAAARKREESKGIGEEKGGAAAVVSR